MVTNQTEVIYHAIPETCTRSNRRVSLYDVALHMLVPLNQKAPTSLSLLEKLFTHPELHVPASRNDFLGYLAVAARHAAMTIFATSIGLSALRCL